MIVKMKKLQVLLPADDREKILSGLASLGTVHIQETTEDLHSERIALISDKQRRYNTALLYLNAIASRNVPAAHYSAEDAPAVIERFEQLAEERGTAQKLTVDLHKDIATLEQWGDYDPVILDKLASASVTVRFFESHQKHFDNLDMSNIPHKVISTSDKVRFITLDYRTASQIDADQVTLPGRSLRSLRNELAATEKRAAAIEQEITSLVPLRSSLEKKIESLTQEMLFERARQCFTESVGGKVLLLTGWLPAASESQIKTFLELQTAWHETSDPLPTENVPVLMKNNAFARMFEPIIKLFQLPNYREIDPTPLVAPFYALFFGTCLGDAGYAVVIMTAALIAFFKAPPRFRQYTTFGLILGCSTLIMGLVNSGTMFGIAIPDVKNVPVFTWLGHLVLIKEGQTIDPFNFALLLGVIQINAGLVLNIVNRITFGSPVMSLPVIGKLLLIDSLVILFLSRFQQYGPVKPFDSIAIVCAAIGILLLVYAVLIAGMEQLMENRIANLVLKLYFTLSGAVGDILSYIRLFALGLSSGILGYVINVMGMQMTQIPYAGWGLCIIFLLAGHSLNLLLACLSSFVHPLRLTFVEFYNNLEFRGGGRSYEPLKKTTYLKEEPL